MSRRPRSEAAASERVTVRLTNAELLTLRQLAANDASDISAVVRRLLEEAAQAARFVDARHSYTPRHINSTLHNPPAWIYTLHHVPGKAEPLAVRRKVVLVDGTFFHVERRAGLSYFMEEDFSEYGFALSDGWNHPDRHHGDDIHFGLGPHFVGYLHVPTQAERDEWRRRRQLALKLLQSPEVWTCLGGTVRQFKCERVRPNGGEGDRRGNVIAKVDDWTELHFNAFCIAYGTSGGASLWVRPSADSWSLRPSKVRVFADRPSASESATECEREQKRAEQERAEREQERRRAEREHAEQERRRQEYSRARAEQQTIDPSLAELGLTWPCAELDVKRAVKAARAATHPDRHGGSSESHAAYLRVNDLEAKALEFVRRNARAA